MLGQSSDLLKLEAKADAQCRKGEWELASKNYKALIVSDPKTARYYYKLGGVIGKIAQNANVFKAMGLVDDAKEALLKALELQPNYLEVIWAQTELYTQLPGILGGGKSAALTFAEKIVAIDPAIGALARSKIYDYYDDKILREQANQIVLSLSTDWCSGSNCMHANAVHFAYGKAAYQNLSQQSKGILFLKRFCKEYSAIDQSTIEEAYLLIAHLSYQIEDFDQAKTYVNLALTNEPNWDEALSLKQKIYSK